MEHTHSVVRLNALLVIQVLLVRRELKVHRSACQDTTVKRTRQYVVLVKQAMNAQILQVLSSHPKRGIAMNK